MTEAPWGPWRRQPASAGLQPAAAWQGYWPRVTTTSTPLGGGVDLGVCFKRRKLLSRGLEQRAGPQEASLARLRARGLKRAGSPRFSVGMRKEGEPPSWRKSGMWAGPLERRERGPVSSALPARKAPPQPDKEGQHPALRGATWSSPPSAERRTRSRRRWDAVIKLAGASETSISARSAIGRPRPLRTIIFFDVPKSFRFSWTAPVSRQHLVRISSSS